MESDTDSGVLEDWQEEFKLAEFKCTSCSCTNFYNTDDPKVTEILESGFGLHSRFRPCTDLDCYCHTGAGKPTRLLHRITTIARVINRE